MVDPPLQSEDVLVVAVTVGIGLTVIVTLAVLVQLFPSVPVTVYVVVAAGETETLEPLSEPGIHK